MAISYIPFEFENGKYRVKLRCNYQNALLSSKYKDSEAYTFWHDVEESSNIETYQSEQRADNHVSTTEQ